MKFSALQLSRKGGRIVNEDRVGYCYTRQAALLVLTDGLGGHAEGEVAAQLVVQSIAEQFQREALPVLPNPSDFLNRAVLVAHGLVLRYAALKHMTDAPRTTVVVAVVQNGTLTWLHCGDSRLYWVRQGQLLARTRDHSYAEMKGVPGLADAQAKRQINRNVLFTCLGTSHAPIWEVSGPHNLAHGDRILLCSDGLWGVLNEVFMVQSLGQRSMHECVPALVTRALQAAGDKSDNVSAIGFEWEMAEEMAFRASERCVNTQLMQRTFESTIQPEYDLQALNDSFDAKTVERQRQVVRINAGVYTSDFRKD